MKTVLHKSETRGFADHGWLLARHTFSFANYYNPQRMHFGALRVLNDDIIQPQTGFGLHPHNNMEIVTIPLCGQLQHTDSMGYTETIKSGDIQRMSAGSGIQHSEFNNHNTELINLLQIWIFPEKQNIKPSYEQKNFPKEMRQNEIQTVVAPEEGKDNLFINQNVWFSLANFDANFSENYKIKREGNGVYIFVIEGKMEVETILLDRRDGIGISEIESVKINATESCEFLIIDVPM